jgi:hypothetical protein
MYRSGSLQDYIGTLRGTPKATEDRMTRQIGVQGLVDRQAKPAQQPATPAPAPKAEETRVMTEKASKPMSGEKALDYTKGGVAVVQGMFEAMQKQKELQSGMMSEGAATKAASTIKRSKMQGEGQQTPLRQLMAAYRPR